MRYGLYSHTLRHSPSAARQATRIAVGSSRVAGDQQPPGCVRLVGAAAYGVRGGARMRRLLRDQSGRNDALDGLRAFAVAAVMAFHFGLPGATAGFLGVDVFFVLSGYLITRILLSQIQAGRLDLRRVLGSTDPPPRSALVVLRHGRDRLGRALSPSDRAATGYGPTSSTSTLAYVANWHFIESGSYFAAMGDESPLRAPCGRLAVEEQFYLAWPIALFVLTRVVRTPVRGSSRSADWRSPGSSPRRGGWNRSGARPGPTAPTWGRIGGILGADLSGLCSPSS